MTDTIKTTLFTACCGCAGGCCMVLFTWALLFVVFVL